MSYQKCPCCDGWGERDKFIPADPKSTGGVERTERVPCPSCRATGIVGLPDMAPVPPPVYDKWTLQPYPLQHVHVGDPPGTVGCDGTTVYTVAELAALPCPFPPEEWSAE